MNSSLAYHHRAPAARARIHATFEPLPDPAPGEDPYPCRNHPNELATHTVAVIHAEPRGALRSVIASRPLCPYCIAAARELPLADFDKALRNTPRGAPA